MMTFSKCVFMFFSFVVFQYVLAVDLQFESPDAGFFLRSPDRPVLETLDDLDVALGEHEDQDGTVMDVEKFTVLDSTRPALIRATYGPFSTKQTVPARYLLPKYIDEEESNITYPDSHFPFSLHSHQLEVSAHLVSKTVSKAKPTLRVLIHGAGARGHHSPHVCVTVLVRKESDSLSASCTPAGAGETGGDATCLVTLSIPSHWWPPHTRATVKLPRTIAKVSYLVGTASGPVECTERDAEEPYVSGPRITVQPETPVGDISLTLEPDEYKDISTDPLVHIMVPNINLRPGTIIHAPLYLHPPGNLPALVFVIRCKVKGGVRVSGVESANPAWNLTVQFKSRRSMAVVTALLSDPLPDNNTLHTLGLHEVFSWVFEVPPDSMAGNSRATWSLQYKMDAEQKETFSPGGRGINRKMNHIFSILKDDIQAVLPIAKSWSIVNTAVLTGRQVSRAVKILMVSDAGKVADVTLQSSCNCTDEAALKVSSSCTSVYLDGSEIRGSHNATIVARYGERFGSASFTVWMPEFPLMVYVKDPKLFQIRNWMAPRNDHSMHPFMTKGDMHSQISLNDGSNVCGLKYQQTPVEIYGKFIAVDDNSGRQSFLLSRQAEVRVTELVSHLLRVADTSIATLSKNIVRGKSPGRTEVQVLSPITGRVIGARELRIASDEVWVSKLHAKVISGLSLSLQPDLSKTEEYTAITTVTPTLTAKYQEGLVDIWVETSDGVYTPIREIMSDQYDLKIRSLAPEIVAVAPSPKESQPRVIAIGHGEGDLLQISLEVPKSCESQRLSLASAVVNVKVKLNSDENVGVHFGDEHHTYPEEASRNDDHDRLSELPIADAAVPHHHYALPEISQNPEVQAHMNPSRPKANALELGMYTLLGIFGVVIVIFAGSCVVYTWNVRGPVVNYPRSIQDRNDSLSQDSVTNAHDWVWLGKATLERASGIVASPSGQGATGTLVPLSDMSSNNNNNNNNVDTQSSWRDFQRRSKNYEQSCLSGHMNITNNPGAELEPLLNDWGEPMDDQTRIIDSSTFTKTKPSRKVKFNNQLQNASAFLGLSDERPPIPPHRNAGLKNGNINTKNEERLAFREVGPPPIPPHGVNVVTNPFEQRFYNSRVHRLPYQAQMNQYPRVVQQKDDVILKDSSSEDSPRFVEVNADDFVRLRGVTRSRAAQVRRATILENPLLSSALPDNFNITDHMENLSPSMDYNQLLEYFSNLKESNA